MDNIVRFSDDCFEMLCEYLYAGDIARMREINHKMLHRVARCKINVFRSKKPLHRSLARILKPTTTTMILEADSACAYYVLEMYFLALPTSLTRLVIDQLSSFVSESCIKSLPNTLTDLELKYLPETFSNTSFKLMPRNLTRFAILSTLNSRGTIDRRNITGDCFVYLPPTMTDFLLPFIGNITQDNMMHMPTSLTRLDISKNSSFCDKFVPLLPRGLLHLNMAAQCLGSACFDDLPPYLTHLNMNHVSGIDSNSLTKLPTTLQSLVLGGQNLTNSLIANFPTSLTSLQLLEAYLLTDECIAHLPRSLMRLCLFGATLTDACIPNLPRRLVSLSLPASCHLLTDACIEHLPRSLTHLNISSANLLTAASAVHFPKNLTVIWVNDKFVFTGTVIAPYCK